MPPRSETLETTDRDESDGLRSSGSKLEGGYEEKCTRSRLNHCDGSPHCSRDRVRIQSLQTEVEFLECERDALRRQVADLTADVESLQAKVTTLEQTVEQKEQTIQEVIDNYEQIIEKKEQAFQELHEEQEPTLGWPGPLQSVVRLLLGV